MRSGPVATLAVVLAASAYGCSLLVDTSGFTGGAAPGGADASLDADGSPADASDAGLTDTARNSVCDDATFCDDFDTLPFGKKWSSSEVVGGATLALEEGGLSAPNGARLFMPTRTGSTTRVAELRVTMTPGARVSCAVDMRIDSAPSVGDGAIMTIRATSGTVTQGDLYLSVTDGGMHFFESWRFIDGGESKVQHDFGTPPLGKWVRLTFATDYTKATVSIDGVIVESTALVVTQPPTALEVGLGERGDTEDGQTSVLFDNFACFVGP